MPEIRSEASVRLFAAAVVAGMCVAIATELVPWTTMPDVARRLHGDSLYGLSSSASPLGLLASVIYAAHVLEHRGCRTVAIWGIVLGALGSVLIAVAPSMVVVLIGRFLNGFTGFTISAALAAVASTLTPGTRRRTTAMMTSVPFPSALVFAQLASFLADRWGWRVAYLPVIVAAAIAVALIAITFPTGHAHVDAEMPERAKRSTTYAVIATALLLLALDIAMPPPIAIVIAVVAATGLRHSLRSVFPAGVAGARPGFPAAVGIRGLWTFGVMSLQMFETFALVRILHAPGWLVGFALAVMELGVAIGGWVFTRMHDHMTLHSCLRISAVTAVCAVAGFCAVVLLQLPPAIAIVPMLLRHLAWGAGFNSSAEAVVVSSPPEEVTANSAVANVSYALGCVLGPGIAGIAFAHLDAIPGHAKTAIAFASLISMAAFLLIAVFAKRVS